MKAVNTEVEVRICCVAVVVTALFSACSNPAPEEEATTDGPARTVADGRQFRMTDGQILVDTFDLRYDLRDGQISLALLSDLGDDATVMVSVSRGYKERGNTEEYSVDYFSDRSTIGAWREPRTIELDHDAWKRELEQRQKIMASAGEPFTVSSIDDQIEISFVVPVNQDPPFQRMNANLMGSAVTQRANLRIVERRISTAYPIDVTGVGQTRFADPLALLPRSTYRLSREVPLMPEVEPADPLEALEAMKRLNAGEEFTVVEVRERRGTPWYRVRSSEGEGWINSTALIGQELIETR